VINKHGSRHAQIFIERNAAERLVLCARSRVFESTLVFFSRACANMPGDRWLNLLRPIANLSEDC
jgi:hypothetical protein